MLFRKHQSPFGSLTAKHTGGIFLHCVGGNQSLVRFGDREEAKAVVLFGKGGFVRFRMSRNYLKNFIISIAAIRKRMTPIMPTMCDHKRDGAPLQWILKLYDPVSGPGRKSIRYSRFSSSSLYLSISEPSSAETQVFHIVPTSQKRSVNICLCGHLY